MKKSLTGFSCPKCGEITQSNEIIKIINDKFSIDGNWSWTEICQCSKCKQKYSLSNGS